MKKPIKSTDPIKKPVVAALKKASGGSKVTSVVQVGPGQFAGRCMTRVKGTLGWKDLGVFEVTVTNMDMMFHVEKEGA